MRTPRPICSDLWPHLCPACLSPPPGTSLERRHPDLAAPRAPPAPGDPRVHFQPGPTLTFVCLPPPPWGASQAAWPPPAQTPPTGLVCLRGTPHSAHAGSPFIFGRPVGTQRPAGNGCPPTPTPVFRWVLRSSCNLSAAAHPPISASPLPQGLGTCFSLPEICKIHSFEPSAAAHVPSTAGPAPPRPCCCPAVPSARTEAP